MEMMVDSSKYEGKYAKMIAKRINDLSECLCRYPIGGREYEDILKIIKVNQKLLSDWMKPWK